ncbi:hypothetical protein J4Q44_G00038500 [Coregonus suidteri]|uniref:Uncharacterized protein n=1 Tax=Coregonus suidteri TaxID=861788 RepID=A0AAN8M4M7_9TELE
MKYNELSQLQLQTATISRVNKPYSLSLKTFSKSLLLLLLKGYRQKLYENDFKRFKQISPQILSNS